MAALLVEGGALVLAGQPDDERSEDISQGDAQKQGERREVAADYPGAFACLHKREVPRVWLVGKLGTRCQQVKIDIATEVALPMAA